MTRISDLAVVAVLRFCEQRVRPEIRDKLRYDVETRGNAITIVECRPPWRADIGAEWTKDEDRAVPLRCRERDVVALLGEP